jgi:hypothetical protein
MWDWAIWAGLAVAVVTGVGATALLVVAVLRCLRGLKRTRRRIFKELDELAASAEAVGEKAGAMGSGGERLARSLAGLAASRRRLALLQAALDEATDAFGWLAVVYPRK